MYKLHTGGRGRIFETLQEASAAAEQIRRKTGIILTITEYKPRRKNNA